MNAGIQISMLLVNTLFPLYIILVMLRWLFALMHADFYNPLSQFVVRFTNPPLHILRRFIPPIGRIDSASVVLMIGLQIVEIYLEALLQGMLPPVLGVLIASIRQLLLLLIYLYFGAIILQVLLSWITPLSGGRTYHPIADLLHSLTRPLLEPIRRIIPTIGMIDLSPLIALLGLNIAMILVQSFLH